MDNLTRRFPLWAALAMFAIYAGTMGHGMTVNSMAMTAKVAGWQPVPLVGQPLLWLLTLPLYLLPAGWVALGMKVLAAALASAIMALLVRTLQLLPWDRSWDKASRLATCLPWAAACVLCGLEFTFWREATSACGELVDLLLLAAVPWLLLEYGVRQHVRWLQAAALVLGVGMAENWVTIFLVPLFLWKMRQRLLGWVSGEQPLERKFIRQLALLWLAGFSVYVISPMVNGLTPHSSQTLGQSWLASLHQTKNLYAILYHQFWRGHRLLMIGVCVYFAVLILPLLIPMRDEGTHNKSGLDQFQTWMFRGLRLCLLLACCWLAFDPTPGARQMILRQMSARMPLLTLDYLTALCAGFLLGNLLLIPYVVVREDYYRPKSKIPWGRYAAAAAALLMALVTLGLCFRNAPVICGANFHPIEEFGAQAVASLPAGGGIMLSDNPQKLVVFQAALAHDRHAADWLAVDTGKLRTLEYRTRLERLRPAAWVTDSTRHDLNSFELRQLLEQQARTNRLFYLHPSYGYFFERFYAEPSQAVYELKLRGKDPLDVPALTDAEVNGTEQFWSAAWNSQLARLASHPTRSTGLKKKLERFGLTAASRYDEELLAQWCSVPLDGWAVALQKSGRLPEAGERFKQALLLNTNNFSARLSLGCNERLQATNHMDLSEVAKLSGMLGDREHMGLLVDNDGPFDEPTIGYLWGCAFLDHKLLIEAAETFERVHALAPGAPAAELALAEVYNRLGMADRGRPLIDHLQAEKSKLPASPALDLDIALVNSYSWLLQTNSANAQEALTSVLEQHPDDPQVMARVLSAYIGFGDYSNALQLVKRELAKSPEDVSSLNAEAVIFIQSGHAREALPVLDHVLSLTNQPAARINRAFARLVGGDFAGAETDLHQLQSDGNKSGMVPFGLGVVDEHRHDTNSAINYFRLCESNSPPGSSLWRQADTHLRALLPPTAAP